MVIEATFHSSRRYRKQAAKRIPLAIKEILLGVFLYRMELQSSSQMYGLAVTPKKCVWQVHFYIGGWLCCYLNDNVFANGGGYFTGAHMRTRSSCCKLPFSFLHVGGLMPPQIFQTCLQEGLNYR